MASTRNFKATPPFATNAITPVPPTPVSGQSYRDETITDGEIETGFKFDTVFETSFVNEVKYRNGQVLDSVDQRGILGYTDIIDYTDGAVVTGSDNRHYQCLANNGPSSTIVDPVADPTFSKWVALDQPQKLAAEAVAIVFDKGNPEQLAESITNIGVSNRVFDHGVGSTANAIIIDLKLVNTPTLTGHSFSFAIVTQNSGAVTLKLDAAAAKPLLYRGTPIENGALKVGKIITVIEDAINFVIISTLESEDVIMTFTGVFTPSPAAFTKIPFNNTIHHVGDGVFSGVAHSYTVASSGAYLIEVFFNTTNITTASYEMRITRNAVASYSWFLRTEALPNPVPFPYTKIYRTLTIGDIIEVDASGSGGFSLTGQHVCRITQL